MDKKAFLYVLFGGFGRPKAAYTRVCCWLFFKKTSGKLVRIYYKHGIAPPFCLH